MATIESPLLIGGLQLEEKFDRGGNVAGDGGRKRALDNVLGMRYIGIRV